MLIARRRQRGGRGETEEQNGNGSFEPRNQMRKIHGPPLIKMV
jgi:hypothetical protein